MAQLPVFVDLYYPDHVCRLKKALYGLRQALFAWFQRFNKFLLSFGFCQCRSDSSLFHFHRGTSIIFLLLYVDNIIVTGNDPQVLWRFIDRTHQEFAIKDLDRLNYFLGLEVSYTSNEILIGKAKYAPAAGESLARTSSSFRDPTLYRSLVGALQYLTITHLDLSYIVNVVS